MSQNKVIAAILATGIALLGVFSGYKWLTIVGLGIWVVAMLLFGRGNRKSEIEADSTDHQP